MADLTHDDEIIQWGFSVWKAREGLFPPRFSDVIGAMEEIPPDFANVGLILEGQAITDKGLGALYSPLGALGPSPGEILVALDGRLLTYIRAFWMPEVGERFEIFKNAAAIVPERAAVGIGYGHDLYAEVYNVTMGLIDEAVGRAKTVGVQSLVEPGYAPVYVIVSGDVIATAAGLFVDTAAFVDDVRATMLTSTPVGQVEDFAIEAEFARPRAGKPGMVTFVAIGFAGLATAAMFATVMTIKGKGKRK